MCPSWHYDAEIRWELGNRWGLRINGLTQNKTKQFKKQTLPEEHFSPDPDMSSWMKLWGTLGSKWKPAWEAYASTVLSGVSVQRAYIAFLGFKILSLDPVIGKVIRKRLKEITAPRSYKWTSQHLKSDLQFQDELRVCWTGGVVLSYVFLPFIWKGWGLAGEHTENRPSG